MTSTPDSPHRLLKLLLDKRIPFCYGLIAVGFLVAGFSVVTGTAWQPTGWVPIVIFGITTALASLGVGLIWLFKDTEEGKELDAARIALLTLGGLIGLGLAAAGVGFTWLWWNDIRSWLGESGPTKDAWWRSLIALLCLMAGLLAMLVTLQLGRTEERSNVVLRRVVYGYNAGLTPLLLLPILAVVVILVIFLVKDSIDFTAAGNYTLNPRSVAILKSLKQPVEVMHVQGFRNRFLEQEVQALLTNVQAVTEKVVVKELAVHRDQQHAREMKKKYPGIDLGCLLVVYNDGVKEEHKIIEEKDLVDDADPTQGPLGHHKFLGEDALITAVNSLTEGKKKLAVYFTQGHRELNINDTREDRRVDTASGLLKRRLEEKRNFEIKPLTFDAVAPKVPDDAALVVVAGPRLPFDKPEVDALRAYMSDPKRDGKMLVLLDVVIGTKVMMQTGLEGFLGEYGIQLPAARLLTVPTTRIFPPPGPTDVVVQVSPELFDQDHPLAVPLADDLIPFQNCRPLVLAGAAPGASRFQAQPFLLAWPISWPETDLGVEPSQVIEELQKDKEKRDQRIRACKPEVIAALVTEPKFDPRNPHPWAQPAGEQTPRMVVFGNATMAVNKNVSERVPLPYYDILANCIEWLRGKPERIGIEPKKRDAFILKTQSDAEYYRMVFLPPVLLIAAVLGIGAGVWIVRRR